MQYTQMIFRILLSSFFPNVLSFRHAIQEFDPLMMDFKIENSYSLKLLLFVQLQRDTFHKYKALPSQSEMVHFIFPMYRDEL